MKEFYSKSLWILSLTSLSLALTLCLNSITVKASLPDSYTLAPKTINIKEPRTFEVYIPYGNPNLNKEIKDVSLGLSIKGESLEIAGEEVYDFYLDDTDLNSNLNFPPNKILDCSLIPKYKDSEIQKNNPLKPKVIPKTLFTKNSILEYGPTSSPQPTTVTTLKPKANGCIGLNLKVSSKAKAGEIVQINVNANLKNSPDYQENERPGITTIDFIMADDQPRCKTSEVLEQNETFIRDKCFKPCPSNQINNYETGECEIKIKICSTQEDNVNGSCFLKCSADTTRDPLGTCKKSVNNLNLGVVEQLSKNTALIYTLGIGIILLLAIATYFIIKKINK
jgi:hypothetical protein